LRRSANYAGDVNLRGGLVDQTGDLAKSTIESLRKWDATLNSAGFKGFNDNTTEEDIRATNLSFL
jgi:hypothetical protein